MGYMPGAAEPGNGGGLEGWGCGAGCAGDGGGAEGDGRGGRRWGSGVCGHFGFAVRV